VSVTSLHLNIYTDGASRGNPGHSAIGAVIYNSDGKKVTEISQYIGIGTNNNAEYLAVITALKEAQKLYASSVQLFLDSELIAKQISGDYRVKSPSLQKHFMELAKLISSFQDFKVTHVLRGKNSEADSLANKALDNKLKS